MRIIPALVLLILAAPAAAQQSPRALVFSYECKHVDPQKTGFKCLFTDKGMELYMMENPRTMPTARREQHDYEFNRLALRFHELGGRHFFVRAAHWPSDKERTCSFPKGRDHYICLD